MKDSEALLDVYLEKVKEDKDSLLEMFKVIVLSSYRGLTANEIIAIRKFINFYGRYRVFYAIVELAGLSTIKIDADTYPYLRFILNKNLKEELKDKPEEADLAEILKLKRKNRKLKVEEIT